MFDSRNDEPRAHESETDSPLFRREVLDAREDTTLGSIRLVYPISQTVWAVAALLLAVLLVTWMCVGEYTRRLRVHGTFVPSAGIIKLRARASGEILKLHVGIGDTVSPGDPVLLLGTEKATEEIAGVGDVVTASLRREAATLQRDLEIASQTAAQESSALKREVAALQQQLARSKEELQIYKIEADRQRNLLEKTRELTQRGFVSAMQLQNQESQASRAEADVARQKSQIAANQRELQEAEDRLAQAPQRSQAQRNEITRQLARTEASITRTESERNLLIQAPSAGEISLLSVYQGQSVAVGQSIGAILPANSRLFAELLVPSEAIGFVDIGSSIAMRYKAFPYQKFGVQWGTVASISRTPLTPNEVAEASGGLPSPESLYRIRVSLPSQTIEAEGRERPLLAGMAIEADIMLERRKIIDWIFEPIYSLQAGLEDRE